MKPFIKTELLTKSFPPEKRGQPDFVVFEHVNMYIEKGEYITCIGHSGCGKSTILNILAGLEPASSGGAFMNGNEIVKTSIERAVVFQNHSLLPWQSAIKNVMFAVRAKWPGWSKEKIYKHSMDYLEMVGLDKSKDKKPYQLSGGMRQRVGIARAFAIQSDLLLMDEPFGALDALTRGVIQEELIKIWSRYQQTVFMITHDVDEAILLSDRIFLMTNGPRANIAEAVVVDIPRPRDRSTIVHHPNYYKIRNYLVDFLVERSHELSGSNPTIIKMKEKTTPDFQFPPNINPSIENNETQNVVRVNS